MGDIGLRLRQAREGAGLSLSELSTRTKIREPLLDAIEREKFERLPAGLLTRGLLRAFAREVGLDPESVVREYAMQFGPAKLSPSQTAPPDRASMPVSQRSRTRVLFALSVLIGTAALLVVYSRNPAKAPAATTSESIATAGKAEGRPSNGPSDPLVSPRAAHAVDVRRPDGFTLEIHPTGPVWVEATADGRRVVYALLRPGERRQLDALNELLVRIGDAAAFQYTINGERGLALGGPGEVRDIRITRDNVTTFLDR
jgi:transcriptional regulator with XRE-family HTH domain